MEEPKEKTFNLSFKESEILAEIQSLEQDEEMELFLKVQRGSMKFNKYQEYISMLEKEKKSK